MKFNFSQTCVIRSLQHTHARHREKRRRRGERGKRSKGKVKSGQEETDKEGKMEDQSWKMRENNGENKVVVLRSERTSTREKKKKISKPGTS